MRLIILSILLQIFFLYDCPAQSVREDLDFLRSYENEIIIKDNNYRDSSPMNNKASIEFRHKNFIARYNPFSLLALSSMYIYQQIVSPQLFRHCLYKLSCSNFSKAAITEFGLIKGVFLSADRLLRCNIGAIDDVPPEDFDIDGHTIDEPSKYHHCR